MSEKSCTFYIATRLSKLGKTSWTCSIYWNTGKGWWSSKCFRGLSATWLTCTVCAYYTREEHFGLTIGHIIHSYTRRFIYCRKSVLHLRTRMYHVRISRCGNVRFTQYIIYLLKWWFPSKLNTIFLHLCLSLSICENREGFLPTKAFWLAKGWSMVSIINGSDLEPDYFGSVEPDSESGSRGYY